MYRPLATAGQCANKKSNKVVLSYEAVGAVRDWNRVNYEGYSTETANNNAAFEF
jgi:hypothetical protein